MDRTRAVRERLRLQSSVDSLTDSSNPLVTSSPMKQCREPRITFSDRMHNGMVDGKTAYYSAAFYMPRCLKCR